MDEPTHGFRASLASREKTYRLTSTALVTEADGDELAIPFGDIRAIRVYGAPGARSAYGPIAPGVRRCVVHTRQGPRVVLSSNHFLGLGRFEDRTDTFEPFVDALVRRVAAMSPSTVFQAGMPVGLWLLWAGVIGGVCALAAIVILVTVVDMARRGRVEWGAVALDAAMLGTLWGAWSFVPAVRAARPRRFDPPRETDARA
jgi:hypothetical protein